MKCRLEHTSFFCCRSQQRKDLSMKADDSSTKAMHSCSVCKKPGISKKCSRCHSQYYCGQEHQQQDWPRHQSECTQRLRINSIKIPANGKFLIVGGALFDMDDDFWITAFHEGLGSIPSDTIQLKVKPLLKALCTNQYSTVIIMNIGSGGNDEPFFHQDVKSLLIEWTRKGGKLMLHGERPLTAVFNEWFDKPWCFRGDFYRRTQFELNSSSILATMAILPSTYNVKCCMLSDVAEEEKLYKPVKGAVAYSLVHAPGFAGTPIEGGMCPVAVSRFGNGTLIFFGDVNAESETIKILICLGQ